MTFILAIDGPAGAGKSTVAKLSAKRLGFCRVDTGAIYRSLALLAKRRREDREEAIAELAAGIDLVFDKERVLLEGEDVSQAIRDPEISKAASEVSALPAVRSALLELQRRIARSNPEGAVLEGRDIGTVVFPDADLKIYLEASVEERARRRMGDLPGASFEEVLAKIKERDARDSQRAVAPLRPADDAEHIDSTKKTADQVVDEIVALVKKVSARKA